MRKKVTIVCDLQFGSTGKGLIAGYLAEREMPDVAVTAWCPNAGHTYIDSNGRRYVHTMLANSIVSPNMRYVLIGAGSVVNLDSLEREIEAAGDMMKNISVFIHPHAAIVNQRHRDIEEQTMTAIGSTKKGSGAAIIEKIQRNPKSRVVAKDCEDDRIEKYLIPPKLYDQIIDGAARIMLEGAQGFSLGINSGLYPYVTSRECTPMQMLSDCGIPAGMVDRIVGSLRTYPIRVANRFDADGNQIGYSGGCYPDQQETTFEAIGQPVELTTVTQLPRRIFTFSKEQIRQAIRLSGATQLFANFVNYLPLDTDKVDFIDCVNEIASEFGSHIEWVGTGATVNDVHNADWFYDEAQRLTVPV